MLPCVLAAAVCNLLAGGLRWKLALGALSARVPFRRSLTVILTVFPLIVLAPVRSNELLRAIPLRGDVSPVVTVMSVFLERIVDVAALLTLMLLGALLLGQWKVAVLLVGAMAAGLGLAIHGVPRLSRWLGRSAKGWLASAMQALGVVAQHPFRGLWVFAAALMSWLAALGILASLLAAFHVQLSVGALLLGWPFAALVGVLPVSLAGMGTRDAAFLLALRGIGMEPLNIGGTIAATLGYAAFGIWLWVAVGLPFFYRSGFRLALGSFTAAEAGDRDGKETK